MRALAESPIGARCLGRWAAWLSVAIVLAGCGARVPTLPPLDAKATVLAFGDSLTFGTGATGAESYPAQLARKISRNVVAAGVPGEVSAAGLARLPAALDEHSPALLILCHGGNDFLQRRDEKEAASNVRAMVKLARDRGIAVMLIATPKPGFSLSPPDFYAAIAKEFDVPVELTVLKTVISDNSLKADLVHPNAQGYGVIADALATLLKNAKAL